MIRDAGRLDERRTLEGDAQRVAGGGAAEQPYLAWSSQLIQGVLGGP